RCLAKMAQVMAKMAQVLRAVQSTDSAKMAQVVWGDSAPGGASLIWGEDRRPPQYRESGDLRAIERRFSWKTQSWSPSWLLTGTQTSRPGRRGVPIPERVLFVADTNGIVVVHPPGAR